MPKKKTETRAEYLALFRLHSAQAAVEAAKQALKAYEDQLSAECRRYAAARPLTVKEHQEIVAHVAAGHELCCEKGLKWLRAKLPEPWALEINNWAYFKLGCKLSPDYRAEHVEKVKALKLDQFPGSPFD